MSVLALLLLAVACKSSVVPIGVTVGITPYAHPISSLYHSQDVYGQYLYGYSTPTSAKSESKTADGVTQGGYSYIDSNGILQTVQYIADPVHGFRVAATNLPIDLPEVAYAKARHLADVEAVRAEHAKIAVAYSNPIVVPAAEVPALPEPVKDLPEVVRARAEHLAALEAAYASATSNAAPQPVQDLPEVVKARAEHLAIVAQTRARDAAIAFSPVHLTGNVVPVHTTSVGTAQISYAPAAVVAPVSSQYHAQDSLGQYSYGYVSPLSSKAESKTADGITRGGYSYIDANGVLQTVNYISDPVNGFRVAATNLPRGPLNAEVATPVVAKVAAPVPVVATKIVTPGAIYSHDIIY